MNNDIVGLKKNLIKVSIIIPACIFILSVGIVCVACSESKNSSDNIYGQYFIYSDDPMVKIFTEGQQTYIQLNKDKSIVYHTTINDKPKFHNEGTFTIGKKNNELIIQWKSGKLPDKLKIEKQGDDNIIKVGSSIYKRKK